MRSRDVLQETDVNKARCLEYCTTNNSHAMVVNAQLKISLDVHATIYARQMNKFKRKHFRDAQIIKV